MSSFLLGVPAKLKTLLDRLTSSRANNLDYLNIAVDSRAPASTALSSSTWTPTKAGYIDQPISDCAQASTAVSNADLTNTKINYIDASISKSRFLSSQEFLSSGTWTRPSGVNVVWVLAIGGGGSGEAKTGGSVGGGGGGEMVFAQLPVTGNVSVTIGAGGAGASDPSNGNPGGDTTFGSLLTARGGHAGGITPLNVVASPFGGGVSAKGGDGGAAGQSVAGFGTGGERQSGAGGGGAAWGDGTDGRDPLSGNGSSSSAAANSGAGSGGALGDSSSSTGSGGSGRLIVFW